MRQAQIFLYANGNDHPPTAIDLSKELLKDLLFNQSPVKVPFIKNEKKMHAAVWPTYEAKLYVLHL